MLCKQCRTKQTVGNSKYCKDCKKIANQKWREMVAEKSEQRDTRYSAFEDAVRKAHEAGMDAWRREVPAPMVVQEHANQLDDASPVVKEWFVSGGACGFASVIVRPGNCSFALWVKKNKNAHNHYYGGVAVPARPDCNDPRVQSYDLNCAYAHAYAQALEDNLPKDSGVTSIRVSSRLD